MTSARAVLSDISDRQGACRVDAKAAEKLAKSDNPTPSDSPKGAPAEKHGWSAAGWRERMRQTEAADAERQAADGAEAAFQARVSWLLNAMMEAEAALAEPDAELDHERAVMAEARAADTGAEQWTT